MRVASYILGAVAAWVCAFALVKLIVLDDILQAALFGLLTAIGGMIGEGVVHWRRR